VAAQAEAVQRDGVPVHAHLDGDGVYVTATQRARVCQCGFLTSDSEALPVANPIQALWWSPASCVLQYELLART
jgi:hypothetical protein